MSLKNLTCPLCTIWLWQFDKEFESGRGEGRMNFPCQWFHCKSLLEFSCFRHWLWVPNIREISWYECLDVLRLDWSGDRLPCNKSAGSWLLEAKSICWLESENDKECLNIAWAVALFWERRIVQVDFPWNLNLRLNTSRHLSVPSRRRLLIRWSRVERVTCDHYLKRPSIWANTS